MFPQGPTGLHRGGGRGMIRTGESMRPSRRGARLAAPIATPSRAQKMRSRRRFKLAGRRFMAIKDFRG